VGGTVSKAHKADKPQDSSGSKPAPGKQPRKPTIENPLVIDGSGPPQVVPVNPFVDREAGELPIARPVSAGEPPDDDAYEPEIPLIPSFIPEQTIVDANLGNFAEQRREVSPGIYDDLQAEGHRGPAMDTADMYLESARRRGLVRHFITPDPPNWTFFSGVFGYPWRGPNLPRWIMMAGGLGAAVVLSYAALSYLGMFDSHLSPDALVGIVVSLLAIGIDVVVLSLVAASCQTAIQDTAEGHLAPQDDTMPELGQWIFIALSWLMLGTAAAAIGFPLSLAIGPRAFLIMLWIFFPFLLLSSLETENILMPLSVPVLRSLGYQFGAWVMFYLLTTLMAAAIGAAAFYGIGFSPGATFLLAGPVLASAALIYSRWLGRLAWKASGSRMAHIELGEPPDDAVPLAEAAALETARAKSKGKKRSRVRIVVPDEHVPREPDDAAPRINFHHPR
jgi:hypothetical protein